MTRTAVGKSSTYIDQVTVLITAGQAISLGYANSTILQVVKNVAANATWSVSSFVSVLLDDSPSTSKKRPVSAAALNLPPKLKLIVKIAKNTNTIKMAGHT